MNEYNSNKQSANEQKVKWYESAWLMWLVYLLLLLAGIALVIYVVRGYQQWLDLQVSILAKQPKEQAVCSSSAWEQLGTIGDSYGTHNSLFAGLGVVVSGVAFIAFIHALRMQKEELTLLRQELKDSREEMKEQTWQIKKQANNTAIQTLHTTLPAYENMMKMRWDEITGHMDEKQQNAWKQASLDAFRSLEFLFTVNDEQKFNKALDDFKEEINTLYESIQNYMPWYTNFFNWSLEVDRMLQKNEINKKEDIRETKRLLLSHLRANQLCILWFCYLTHHTREDSKTPDFLTLWDLKQLTPIYNSVEIDSIEQFPKSALELLSDLLSELRTALLWWKYENQREYLCEYEDTFHDTVKKAVRASNTFTHVALH